MDARRLGWASTIGRVALSFIMPFAGKGALALLLSLATTLAMAVNYTLTISPAPQNGTVTSNPGTIDCSFPVTRLTVCSDQFAEGSTVRLRAIPDPNYGFIRWTTPAGTSTVNPLTSVMPGLNVSVSALFGLLPGAPTLDLAIIGSGSVTIYFTAPAPNGGSAITGYTATCDPGGFTASGAASGITVSGLTNGTTYSCSVAATNAAGTGASSNAMSVIPGIAPSITSALPPNGVVGRTYSHTFAATGSPAPTFLLAAGSFPSGLSLNGTTGALTGTPTAAGTFVGTLRASNALASATQSFSITISATVPSAPTIGTAVAGNGQASIAFTPPVSDGGSAITRYTATCNPGGFTASGTSSPVTVGGLANGTTYSCSVTATNAIGTGASSGTVSVRPGSVVITSAPPPNGFVGRAYSHTFTATGSSAPTFLLATGSFPSGLSLNGTTGTLSGTPTTVGTFAGVLQASSSLGVATQSFSITISAAVPLAPTIGAAVAGNGQASVSFTPPASNGGSAITGYTATCNPGGFSGSGQTSPIIVKGLANGTNYSCFVTATNALGTSVPSASASVTPFGGPPPVFPITVRTNINATTATASADIRFRPQDVGTTGNVYVFAVAPSTLVKAAADNSPAFIVGKSLSTTEGKDIPANCVLAQLNSAGQLHATSVPNLQAYLTGVLTSMGATVPIMTNVSTPNVAGATFYLGYGTSSTAMMNNGIYQSAVTVPGGGVCPMISSQTALWWNPAESGWGVNFNHQGNILFATLFTYDATRAPLWLVMSNGAMLPDGVTFSGDLYRTTGPAFNAIPFTPIGAANQTRVGSMTASFANVNAGTLQYTVNGVEVTKSIERQVFGSRAASCMPSTASRASATNYQDLWWNPAESGWGINVTHQDNTLFATLFTYDETGKGLWLVMSAGQRQSDGSYFGDLYRASGPPFNSNPFTPITAANITTVGTMRLRFTDGNNGVLTYTYNGAPVTKSITRQMFSSPVPMCN